MASQNQEQVQEQVREIIDQNTEPSFSRNPILENLRENEQKHQQMMQEQKVQDLEKRELELFERKKRYDEEFEQWRKEFEQWQFTTRKLDESCIEIECENLRKNIKKYREELENYKQEKERIVDDLKDTAILCGIYDPEQTFSSSDTMCIDKKISYTISCIEGEQSTLEPKLEKLTELRRYIGLKQQIRETNAELERIKTILQPIRDRTKKIKKLIMEEEQRPRYLAYAQKHCIEYNKNDRFDLFRKCCEHHHWLSHKGLKGRVLCGAYVILRCVGDFNSKYDIKVEKEEGDSCHCPENLQCRVQVDDLSRFNLDSTHTCNRIC